MIVAVGERKECSWRGKIRRVHRDGPCTVLSNVGCSWRGKIRRVHRDGPCTVLSNVGCTVQSQSGVAVT